MFKREIQLGHKMEIRLRLSKARPDGSRWSIQHDLVREDGTICAVLTTDGAWIDTRLRKLTVPPPEFMEEFLKLPHTDDFQMLPMPEPAKG